MLSKASSALNFGAIFKGSMVNSNQNATYPKQIFISHHKDERFPKSYPLGFRQLDRFTLQFPGPGSVLSELGSGFLVYTKENKPFGEEGNTYTEGFLLTHDHDLSRLKPDAVEAKLTSGLFEGYPDVVAAVRKFFKQQASTAGSNEEASSE